MSNELRRLHNLGLSGGFLAISFGLALILLPVGADRSKRLCRILLPSLLIVPVGFTDQALIVVAGPIPLALQVFFYGLQAASALGITAALALLVVWLFQNERASP
ncbi:MAG: hypothetical protein L0Y71_00160 [Gemmataceae bacterium]|nr:hypothetical protein [Gemmataceae bacterium]